MFAHDLLYFDQRLTVSVIGHSRYSIGMYNFNLNMQKRINFLQQHLPVVHIKWSNKYLHYQNNASFTHLGRSNSTIIWTDYMAMTPFL